MIENITSVQNPKIKNVLKLQKKSSERKQQNLIVIEGLREIELAIKAGMQINSLFYCPEIITKDIVISKLGTENRFYILNENVYNKVAYRGSTEGVIALAEPKFLTIDDIALCKNPIIIVLESVEKPGNLGAILRTTDAAGIDAVIVSDPLTDIYNPNIIRSSIGCVFTNQVVACSSDETIKWLKTKRIRTFATGLTATTFYHQTNLKGAVAIVMGTEADGLTDKWLDNADEQIKIPMSGEIDSLNVSTSTAILIFEAMRQRNFNK